MRRWDKATKLIQFAGRRYIWSVCRWRNGDFGVVRYGTYFKNDKNMVVLCSTVKVRLACKIAYRQSRID